MKNKMQANEPPAAPVLRCSFRIINWHQEEIIKLKKKAKKVLTVLGQLYPNVDTNRLYAHRKEGERKVLEVKVAYIAGNNVLGAMCRKQRRFTGKNCKNTPT
jgi:hypothetical protein